LKKKLILTDFYVDVNILNFPVNSKIIE
jgi:hypothetical protein